MAITQEQMDAFIGGEVEPILPDGWQDGDDLFAEVNQDVDSFVADGSGEVSDLETENDEGNSESVDPTTVENGEEEIHSDEIADEIDTPDGEREPQTRSRKLKLKVNHREEEVDIDKMSDEDLTALLQKGRAFDAMKESENKQKYRRIYQEQIDAGMTDAAARMVAQNEAGGTVYPLEDVAEPEPETPVVQPKETAPVRDFKAEYEQLLALYPEVKQLPDEVVKVAAAKDISLLNAFMAYRDKQSAKTAASLKRENEVLKQNAASAAKAPVRGVTGGGNTAPKKADQFIAGFNSDPW